VYGPKSARNHNVPTLDDRSHVSMLFTINAAGNSLPPLYIFMGERMQTDLLAHAPPGSSCRFNKESAYMNKEIFLEWFRDIFLVKISASRPQLLICDGHESHFSLELVELARANKIEIVLLPSHTSHVLQPLDKSVFSAFKKGWEKAKRLLSLLLSLSLSLSLSYTHTHTLSLSRREEQDGAVFLSMLAMHYRLTHSCTPTRVKQWN
jgi:hypothetical protein